MEDKSGVSFDQAEVALVRKWLGNPQMNTPMGTRSLFSRTHSPDVPSSITVKSPIPAQTCLGTIVEPSSHSMQEKVDMVEPTAAEEKKVPVPATEEEANKLIELFQKSAGRSDDTISDTVGQHVQRDITTLDQEQWLGTEDEERNAYVSEEIYIHTKVRSLHQLFLPVLC